jgi:DNA topoisomerase-1
MNGLYGPYLSYDGKNYRLPKNMHENAKELTYAECMKVIEDLEALKGEDKGTKKARKGATKKTTKKATA